MTNVFCFKINGGAPPKIPCRKKIRGAAYLETTLSREFRLEFTCAIVFNVYSEKIVPNSSKMDGEERFEHCLKGTVQI